MKKLLSIVLLWIFLFNIGGYCIFLWGVLYTAHKELKRTIDQENFLPEHAYEFKIPLVLPYPVHREEYKRVDGEFERNGEFYTLVKQKLENDTLYILCVKNHTQKKVRRALIELAGISRDGSTTGRTLDYNLANKLIKEYYSHDRLKIMSHNNGWCRSVCYTLPANMVSEKEKDIFSPPPNTFC